MIAWDLIESIYARPQRELPGNVRRITGQQLKYLRDLIDRDYPGELRADGPWRQVWPPHGAHRYALIEDPAGKNHRREKFCGVGELSGSLF